jgi:hypothetical protein
MPKNTEFAELQIHFTWNVAGLIPVIELGYHLTLDERPNGLAKFFMIGGVDTAVHGDDLSEISAGVSGGAHKR